MKVFQRILLLTFAVQLASAADIVTLTGDNSYTVGTNEVVEIISVGTTSPGALTFLLNGSLVYATKTTANGGIISTLPMMLTGPSNTIAAVGNAFVTLRVRTKTEFLDGPSTSSFASSTSVVIPEDADGPVDIVMESSTDLVNWNVANPGTYGSSANRRFFRVRAIRK